jgi:hypothetical protein
VSTAIGIHARMILIVSDASMSSKWVATEIRHALRIEDQDGKKKIFPIRIVDYNRIAAWKLFDSDTGEDLAARVREYYIPDFSNWNDPTQMAKAITRLVTDLRQSDNL